MNSCDLIYSYWNNQSVGVSICNWEEILHIRKSDDGTFCLQIGNTLHRGALAELEVKLYEWAMDEGWLDVDRCGLEPHGSP